MKNLSFALLLSTFLSLNTFAADNVFRIEIGKDFKSYSNSDLQRRVWELERAVSQLQMKVFQLETAKPDAPKTWSCSISALGEEYTGAGDTKATAINEVMSDCRKNAKDKFFCSNPKCEQ